MAAITLTDTGRNLRRDALSGANSALIKYVELGTDSTAPSSANTKLGAAVARYPVTSYTVGGTGEILINMYLAPGELNGTAIAEVGFIGGSTATATLNTGVLLARGLYSHTKANTESIQFQLDFTETT